MAREPEPNEVAVLQKCEKYAFQLESASRTLKSDFKKLPLQDDMNDCGVFMLEFIIRAWLQPLHFVQAITDDNARKPLFDVAHIKKRRVEYRTLIAEIASAKSDEELAKLVRSFTKKFI